MSTNISEVIKLNKMNIEKFNLKGSEGPICGDPIRCIKSNDLKDLGPFKRQCPSSHVTCKPKKRKCGYSIPESPPRAFTPSLSLEAKAVETFSTLQWMDVMQSFYTMADAEIARRSCGKEPNGKAKVGPHKTSMGDRLLSGAYFEDFLGLTNAEFEKVLNSWRGLCSKECQCRLDLASGKIKSPVKTTLSPPQKKRLEEMRKASQALLCRDNK